MEAKDINFAAMPQTAVQVVTAPAAFFKSMPKAGGFIEPLIFVAIMGVITGIVQAILSLLSLSYRGGMGLSAIIVFPIVAVIGSFIGAAIIFVIWKLMGSQENYETSYRCTAYLMALAPITAILSIIPYAGGIINIAIYTFYIVAASTQVHNIPSQKAWMVFGIIGLIFVLLGLRAEYTARHISDRWKTTTEETAKQYQKYLEEAKKQAEEARQKAEQNR